LVQEENSIKQVDYTERGFRKGRNTSEARKWKEVVPLEELEKEEKKEEQGEEGGKSLQGWENDRHPLPLNKPLVCHIPEGVVVGFRENFCQPKDAHIQYG